MTREVSLHMYITLDGYNVFPNYPGSGDPPKGERDPVSEEMWVNNWKNIDTILLGHETYLQWEDFWPGSNRKPEEDQFYHDFSRFLDEAQKICFSRTLKKTHWRNSRIERGDLTKAIARLKEEPGKNIAVGGGTGFAQALMKRNLIDEYFLCVFPVILGKGPPLFGPLRKQVTLSLISAKPCRWGEVVMHYRTLREGGKQP